MTGDRTADPDNAEGGNIIGEESNAVDVDKRDLLSGSIKEEDPVDEGVGTSAENVADAIDVLS